MGIPNNIVMEKLFAQEPNDEYEQTACRAVIYASKGKMIREEKKLLH